MRLLSVGRGSTGHFSRESLAGNAAFITVPVFQSPLGIATLALSSRTDLEI
jgi:hypothetical protein